MLDNYFNCPERPSTFKSLDIYWCFVWIFLLLWVTTGHPNFFVPLWQRLGLLDRSYIQKYLFSSMRISLITDPMYAIKLLALEYQKVVLLPEIKYQSMIRVQFLVIKFVDNFE